MGSLDMVFKTPKGQIDSDYLLQGIKANKTVFSNHIKADPKVSDHFITGFAIVLGKLNINNQSNQLISGHYIIAACGDAVNILLKTIVYVDRAVELLGNSWVIGVNVDRDSLGMDINVIKEKAAEMLEEYNSGKRTIPKRIIAIYYKRVDIIALSITKLVKRGLGGYANNDIVVEAFGYDGTIHENVLLTCKLQGKECYDPIIVPYVDSSNTGKIYAYVKTPAEYDLSIGEICDNPFKYMKNPRLGIYDIILEPFRRREELNYIAVPSGKDLSAYFREKYV